MRIDTARLANEVTSMPTMPNMSVTPAAAKALAARRLPSTRVWESWILRSESAIRSDGSENSEVLWIYIRCRVFLFFFTCDEFFFPFSSPSPVKNFFFFSSSLAVKSFFFFSSSSPVKSTKQEFKL